MIEPSKVFKVLVTGKTSNTANAFSDYILESSYDDIVVDKISLRDTSFEDMNWSSYDVVLHAAGISKADDGRISKEQQEKYYSINRDLAFQAASKAKSDGVSQFILLSTMMVYGNSSPIGKKFIIDDDTEPIPASYYGRSKLEGEKVLELADDGFKVAVIRESVVYGEHFKGELYKLSKIASRVCFFPDIDSTKSYIYEGNLCELFRQIIIKNVGGIFYPQNKEQLTTSEIYKLMAEIHAEKKGKRRNCALIKGLKPVLCLLSHITHYVNVVFNDMRYAPELSHIEGIDYQVYSFEESLRRCL